MNELFNDSARGKLLVAGEYLVLAGATALALPLKYGQTLEVEETDTPGIEWESHAPSGKWFSARFDNRNFRVLTPENLKIAERLKTLLLAARQLNPWFLVSGKGFKVKTRSNYPLEWGLGSSSTLCYLVASWAGVKPHDLHTLTSNGSGYDVACAGSRDMLFYRLVDSQPETMPAFPGRAMVENTWFVYLGFKKNTEMEVTNFLANFSHTSKEVDHVSELSTLICNAKTYDELFLLVEEHESVLSTIMKREPIARRFPTFPGTVKSLGAWGGDFAMFVSGSEPGEVKRILTQLGFSDIFRFNDLKAVS